MDAIRTYLDAHKHSHLDALKEILRIPSVSTSPEHAGDVQALAEHLRNHLESIGLKKATVHSTPGHPIVTAEWLHAPDAPTVLIYGHYDVQPADPLELWETPPFEPTQKGDRLYARGASDDKGQSFIHVCALEAWLATEQRLPVNVKILLEGEEEIGSPNLVPFLEENKVWCACDTVLVSDTAMFGKNQPSITVGLRGLAYLEVHVEGPTRDLHSGVYGGAAPNPATILNDMLSQCIDLKTGKILIPGFYDEVIELTKAEQVAVHALPFSMDTYTKSIGIEEVVGEPEYTVHERVSSRPTFDVNGLWGGYQGEGAKTVLPAKAGAKVSMRLVPNQDPQSTADKFKSFIHSIAPPSVRVNVINHHGGSPVVMDLTSDPIQKAAQAFKEVYQTEVFFTREGGSIPIIADFKRVLGVDSVLMGFGLNEDGLHSPNESFSIEDFYRGREVSARFLAHMASDGTEN
tara:strand:+ start:164 stop:1546 length:1383 start_codon:yes stop_codon:yes gene_type:complete